MRKIKEKVKENGNTTEKAVGNIKYYVKLFKECGGSSDAFWKKLMPSATVNDDNQIINTKRNAHFPNYLRRRPFMSLIEKIVRSSYEQQQETVKAETAEVLSAGEEKKHPIAKIPSGGEKSILKHKHASSVTPRDKKRATDPSQFRSHDESPFD